MGHGLVVPQRRYTGSGQAQHIIPIGQLELRSPHFPSQPTFWRRGASLYVFWGFPDSQTKKKKHGRLVKMEASVENRHVSGEPTGN